MMGISVACSQKIKNMSFICALLVVAIHVDWYHGVFSFTWLVYHFVRGGISQVAVPYFFVVSGFLLSIHMDDYGWYKNEVKKRVYSLVIPFVVWSIIATILITPLSIIADIIANRPFGYTPGFTNWRWIETFGLDPRHGPNCIAPLWYVRCLFCFVVLSPVFKWLVVKGGLVWLACAFTLTLAHSSLQLLPEYMHKVFSLGFSLSGVFYFSVGIYIGLVRRIEFHRCYVIGCSMVGLLLVVLKMFAAYFAIDTHINLITIAIPFLMYSLWFLIPSSKWASAITACSFPIYLIHRPVLKYISLPIKYSILHDSQIGSAIMFIGALILSICTILILRKRFPRINSFLFAGRS